MATQPRLSAAVAERTLRTLALALMLSALVWLIATPATHASGGSGYAIDHQSYVVVAADSTLKPAAVCIEAWVKIETHLGGNQYIVFTQNSRFPHYVEGYTLYIGGTEDARFAATVASAEGQQVGVGSHAPVVLGRWYHLAMLADGEALTLYVNGELQGTASTGFALDYGNEPIYIGHDGIGADGFVYGAIDEVRIWDTTLDAATLRQWMHREVTSAHDYYDHLRGYWKLNEGSGSTVYDASGHHHDGALYDQGLAPWVVSQAPINNLTAQRHEITALWDNRPSTATDGVASGLDISDVDFLTDVGDDIVFGHNNASFARVSSDLPDGVDRRWARVWELAVTQIWPMPQSVDLTFDISDAGGAGSFSPAGSYFLLRRPAGSSDPFTTVPVLGSSVVGDQVTLRVDVAQLGSEFTLGVKEPPPLAIGVRGAATALRASALPVVALLAVGLAASLLRRRRTRIPATD